MGIATRGRTRLALAALALVVGLAVIDGLDAAQRMRWNQLIESGEQIPETDREPPAQVRFAQTYMQAAAGADEAALKGYHSLQGTPLAQSARFNSANLLMRQAIALRATPQPGQAIPLIELAKQTYREILRNDPNHWDARYNLERAQRLLPDPEDSAEPALIPRNAERAATTMRGYSPGLP